MPVNYDKVFTYKIENVSFGNLSNGNLTKLFQDGRTSSPFLEQHIPLWFPYLKWQSGNKKYDHIDNDGNKYDAKNFTKHGLFFLPSSQIGSGRKINDIHAKETIDSMTYILCDIEDFPKIRIKFYSGKKLLNEYPKYRIPYNDREKIFG